MSTFYETIGRAVVWLVRYRYGRQIRIALGIGLASILLGGYLAASRRYEEG
ncbi:MAG: hypothetical protein ACRDL3_06315 [Solirubrobacterales bacterium]